VAPPASPLPLAPLLHGLSDEPGRPRLTWYGPDGERIELSGHVLDNWVTKTTNLLVEEFSAGPGTRVVVDLPVHWRTVVWCFAAWRAGACVELPAAQSPVPADLSTVVVTDRPERHVGTGTGEIVAVALPALARSFPGDLPRGAVDAAGAVMTYGDVLTWLPEADVSAPALVAGATTVDHAGLLGWAASAATASEGRVLLTPAQDALLEVLATVLTVYAARGSVVLCAPEVAAELAADEVRRERLVATEGISR
jgi:uncharacterized protein (TIGR03089 family)